MTIDFNPYPKTARLYREVIISEKIDGTNSAVVIAEGAEPSGPDNVHVTVDGNVYTVKAQSRNRFIAPGADNYGFAAWVWDNAEALTATLGVGIHFGEWWGKGIQRGYSMTGRRFSLFNVTRWQTADLAAVPELRTVPVLYVGPLSDYAVSGALQRMSMLGSEAAHREGVPGKHAAEGVIVWHTAANRAFKVLLDNDALPKSALVTP